MIRRPPRSTQSRSSAASDVYKRQVHELVRRGEELDAFQEEGPLFREEQRKAFVHGYLARVRLHLAEVRVYRRIQRQVGRGKPQIDAGVDVRAPPHQPRGDVTTRAVDGRRDERLDLGHDTALHAVSYTHLRAHETRHDLVCRLLLEKKK